MSPETTPSRASFAPTRFPNKLQELERAMAEAKVLSGAGLRGQVAGQTALSNVGQAGAGLTYRGYDVRELAAEARFEEVAYLLLYGELPTQAQLSTYMKKMQGLRDLPQALKEVLERIPVDTHQMD